jgi:hypothetical protein
VPSLHKLYSLATILHLDPLEISVWYEAPFRESFQDGASFPAPHTHLSQSSFHSLPPRAAESGLPSETTALLQQQPSALGPIPTVERSELGRFLYGRVGLLDRRMVPLLRPGSTVLIDTTLRRIEDTDWSNEYDRPMYFVEIRNGYRCGWFQKEKSRLIMQPHTLSRCAPEAWKIPDNAEVLGQVVAVVTYLGEPWTFCPATVPAAPSDWNRKAQ